MTTTAREERPGADRPLGAHAHAPRRSDRHTHADGAVMFGRYALPPNEKGYCGPDRADELLERVHDHASGRALAEVARGFEGAWPYLELIGDCLGRAPLDPLTVRTYWLGGRALARCGGRRFADSLETRFKPRLTRVEFERLSDAVALGATPHHSFHVFGVYPWVGLLRGGMGDTPLEVLDLCRIRWGRVDSIVGDSAVVTAQHLAWDGTRLGLDPPRAETARVRRDGHALARDVQPGDWVALHWDWVCERLTLADLQDLRASTLHELRAVNACQYTAPAAVLA